VKSTPQYTQRTGKKYSGRETESSGNDGGRQSVEAVPGNDRSELGSKCCLLGMNQALSLSEKSDGM